MSFMIGIDLLGIDLVPNYQGLGGIMDILLFFYISVTKVAEWREVPPPPMTKLAIIQNFITKIL